MAARRQGAARLSGIGHPPVRVRLEDGRWHFQHGPIDLIIELCGERAVCERALAECWERFGGVLAELVAELPMLRRPAAERPVAIGSVAQRMVAACAPFAALRFITPMAAVAGAVADELLEFCKGAGIQRAVINNGGDIALHLVPGEIARVGICAYGPELDGRFAVAGHGPTRGIATSGCRGRSLSLGIADSVTVLAANAAAADAAATLIANAVICDHPGIVRAPANEVKDNSDLGACLVTVRVPPLPPFLRAAALESGRREAERWLDDGLIHAAALILQGECATVLPAQPAPRMLSAPQFTWGRLTA